MAARNKNKKLVYSPKAYVFIRSFRTGQIVDVSNDVTSGHVSRLINQPSTASVTLKNPNYRYTGRFEPMFEPMDVMTIWLQRIAGKPIQVFTGYIDDLPLYQMYPNNVEIQASCTLKRLMHTYFDPGLPEMIKFFQKNGWNFDPQTGASIGQGLYNMNGTPDGGFGNLLRNFLIEVCGWDQKAIIISALPDGITGPLAQLYNNKMQGSEDDYNAMKTFFDKLLTMRPASAADSGTSNVAPGVVADQSTISRILSIANELGAGIGGKPSQYEIILAATVMTRIDKDHVEKNAKIDQGYGIFAMPQSMPNYSYTEEKVKSLKSSIEIFISTYIQVNKNRDPNESKEQKVALTLSVGFGKDEYYTDILEACNNANNATIANTIADTGTPDGVSSKTVSTAAVVESASNADQVTWEKLMSTETSNVNATDYDGKGIVKGGNVVYKMNAEYESVAKSTVYYGPLGGNISIDLNKLKYYVVVRGKKPTSKAVGDALGDTPIGAMLRISNPKNGKSLMAMVADFNDKKSPPIGLSPAILTDLGLMQSGKTSWSGDVYVEYNTDSTFNQEDLTSNAGSAGSEVKPEVINRIIPTLGVGGGGTPNFRFKNINDQDRSVYEKNYKNSNDILSEYFFVANDMNLRLANPATDDKNTLAVKTDSSNFNSAYLDNFAKWAASQIDVEYVIRIADNGYRYAYSANGSSAKTNSKSELSVYTNEVFVKIKPNAPRPLYNGATVDLPTTDDQQTAGVTTGQEVHWQDLAKLSLSSSLSAMFSLPTNYIESFLLKGDRALMNDIPVFTGVKQFSFASMRQFMSLPNGQFVAFYPDNFGTFGRTPYWPIFDIEIEDLSVNRNDTELVTHMYVNGAVWNPTQGPQLFDRLSSLGIVTVEDMLETGFIKMPPGSKMIAGPNEGTNQAAPAENPDVQKYRNSFEFLQKYGARPLTVDDPLIRSPFFEFVSAVNQFLFHWGKTFSTNARIAFQPELMAGGIVHFPEHDNLRLYIEQVTHVWDYEAGFQTQAVFSSPHQPEGGTIPGMPQSGRISG